MGCVSRVCCGMSSVTNTVRDIGNFIVSCKHLPIVGGRCFGRRCPLFVGHGVYDVNRSCLQKGRCSEPGVIKKKRSPSKLCNGSQVGPERCKAVLLFWMVGRGSEPRHA